ncbi:hypothetical protein Hanom_Chr11g01034741 [Helianthus anomalus]
MESRVLSSGATTISGLPRLTRPVARLNTVAVASPASLNTTGGNLVWGRQLRPSLLNLDYSVQSVSKTVKREVLKPCAATASEGDAAAAPVGFLAKNPWLTTGFFFFMW